MKCEAKLTFNPLVNFSVIGTIFTDRRMANWENFKAETRSDLLQVVSANKALHATLTQL